MPYWRIQLCALPWLNFWYIGLLTFHGVHFICELFCLQDDCVCRLHMSLHVTRKGHGLSGRACSMIHSNFSWRETGKEPLAISRVYLIARLDKFISGLGCGRYPSIVAFWGNAFMIHQPLGIGAADDLYCLNLWLGTTKVHMALRHYINWFLLLPIQLYPINSS